MKRTLAFLLSLMMVLSMLPAAALATEEAPVSEAPANAYTRIEAARVLSNALGLEYHDDMASWAYDDLSVDTDDGQVAAMMAYYSIMQNGAGAFYGNFGPNETIQRYDMAMCLTRALTLERSDNAPSDAPLDYPFGPSVAAAVAAGLMSVDADGKFRPYDPTLEGDVDLDEVYRLAHAATLTMSQTTDNVVVTYTVPDMTTAAEELKLWKYDSDSGRSKLVTHEYCTDTDDWEGNTFTWVIDGHSFAEHGEGHYYCTAENAASETIESGKLAFEFGYAQTAVQLAAPSNVALNGDSSLLTYTSANPVMAVAWQMDGDEILWQDYVLVSDEGAAVSELLNEDAVAGTCYLAVFAYSRKDYVNNKPSDWVTVEFQYGVSDQLTRAKLCVLVVNKFDFESTGTSVTFTDLDDCTEDQKEAILLLAQNDLVAGTAPGVFSPNNPVTGKVAAALLYRALTRDASLKPDEAVAALVADGILSAGEATDDIITKATFKEWLSRIGSDAPLASGDCGAGGADNLQWSLSADYELTITGTGAMEDYNDAPWYDWAEDITAVSLPEGLTHLGDSAFYKCSALTEIDLPDSLETIGSRALATTGEALESLHIPANVTEIGINALGFNSALTEITVDAANTAFYMQNDCLLTADGETLVACPGGLTGKVTLPDSITTIGSHACCGSSADTFILPDTLTTIEYGSFFGSELTSIQIPASVTVLGDEAFFRCKGLDSVTFEGNAPTLCDNVFGNGPDTFCIYYDPATTGWKTPEWNGWPAYPIGTLTRVQLCQYIYKRVDLESTDETISFTDIADCTPKQQDVIILLAQHDIVDGYADGTFGPYDTATQLQAAIVLYRALTLDTTAAPDTALNWLVSEDILLSADEASATAIITEDVFELWLERSLTPAQTPAYVQWGKRDQGDTLTDAPGWLVFPAQGDSRYGIDLYRVKSGDETEDVKVYTVTSRASEEDIYCSIAPFARARYLDAFVTGDYYAVVTPMGDGITTSDGAPVTSDVWSFTRPDLVFEATNAAWGADNTLTWESNVTDSNRQYVERYAVQFYFNPDEDDPDPKSVEELPGNLYYPGNEPFAIPDALLEEYGEGWYYFDVNIQTTNPCNALSTGESDPSPALHYTGPESPLSVSKPVWGNGMTLSWTDTSDDPTLVDRYWVQFLHNPDEDNAEKAEVLWHYNYYAAKAPHIIAPIALEKGGEGWYYFRVQARGAVGSDIPDSEWSALSAGCRFTKPAKTLAVTEPVLSDPSTINPDATSTLRLDWRFLPAEDEALVQKFEVQFHFSKEESDDPDDYELIQTPSVASSWRGAEISYSLLSLYGDGWYMAAVRPVTNDPLSANTGEWVYSAPFQYLSPLPAARQATDLGWHTGYRWDGQSYSQTGMMSFKGEVADGCNFTDYTVELFRKEQSGDVSLGTTGAFIRSDRSGSFLSVDAFAFFSNRMETGTYYFTVTTHGNQGITKHSQPVKSSEWTYTRPDSELEIIDPSIRGDLSVEWTFDGDLNQLREYEVEFGYAPYNQLFYEDSIWRTNYQHNGPPLYVPDEFLAQNGDGKYYFRIRTVSRDPYTAVPSRWTDWVGPIGYNEPDISFTVSNAHWDGNTPEWEDNYLSGAPLLYYQIRYYYGETAETVDYDQCIWDTTYSRLPVQLPEKMLAEYGEGYYGFMVKAVSSDLSEVKSSGWAQSDAPRFFAGLPKLGTPTDLKWHISYEENWDNNGFVSQTAFERMGSVAFKRPVDENGDFFDQGQYDIRIFRINADGSEKEVSSSGRGIGSTSPVPCVADHGFIYGDLDSGTYFFKVRCRADDGNYAPSDWADSRDWADPATGYDGTFTFTRPASVLSTPSGLRWNDRKDYNFDTKLDIAALWTPVDNAHYYFVEYYGAATETGAKERLSGSMDIRHWEGDDLHNLLREHTIAEYGEGWYFFKVQAVPADITRYRISEWSGYSIGYDLDLTVDKVNDQLDSIDTSTSSASDIQEALTDIQHLDKAMAADAEKGTTDTLDKLKDLEDAVKSKLNVQTAIQSTTTAIDSSKVKASNMALNVNTATAQDTTVTLNITTPADPNVAPPSQLINTQNENTVIFSMDIDGAVDASPAEGKQLKIPVQITLPVPAGINPAFLVILHEKSEDDWEELTLPHVYEEDGQWYATFNVHSFSHYAMGEKALTAQAEGNTVTLQAHLPTKGVQTQYLCAVYSAQGQMLGVGVLQPQSDDQLVITLDQEVPAGATMLIFAPDAGSGWSVHSAPATATIVSE
ncbi:MAG: leucine-rich repeat protein [Clostridia bacterium]|nr:leucine-rich repeat protein [Clostridia bacterium]